jgi:hypothetical protein
MGQDMGDLQMGELRVGSHKRITVVVDGVSAVGLETLFGFFEVELATDDAAMAVADKTLAPETGDPFWCPKELTRFAPLGALDGGMHQRRELGRLARGRTH